MPLRPAAGSRGGAWVGKTALDPLGLSVSGYRMGTLLCRVRTNPHPARNRAGGRARRSRTAPGASPEQGMTRASVGRFRRRSRPASPAFVCGRPLRCKGGFDRIMVFGAIAVVCPACWRGASAAGPDGLREGVPNGQTASEGLRTRLVAPLVGSPGHRLPSRPPCTCGPDARLRRRPAQPVAGRLRRAPPWPARCGPSCWPAPRPRACAACGRAIPAARAKRSWRPSRHGGPPRWRRPRAGCASGCCRPC